MDVLLTYLPKNHANGELGAVIFWGQNQTLGEFVLNVFNICHWILKEKHAWYSQVNVTKIMFKNQFKNAVLMCQ